MFEVPDVIEVRVLVDGEPTAGLWVASTLRMARKNDHRCMHGPSDAAGHVAIDGTEVLRRAQQDRDMFLMDYGSVDRHWTGEIELRVANRDDMRSVLDAASTWGADAWAYPPQIRRGLEVAIATLETHEGELLTVEVAEPPGAARVIAVASRV